MILIPANDQTFNQLKTRINLASGVCLTGEKRRKRDETPVEWFKIGKGEKAERGKSGIEGQRDRGTAG